MRDLAYEITLGSHHPLPAEGATDDELAAWWRAFAAWPPNVFALTSAILADTGAYRFLVSPPLGVKWAACDSRDRWIAGASRLAREWLRWTKRAIHDAALQREPGSCRLRPVTAMPVSLVRLGKLLCDAIRDTGEDIAKMRRLEQASPAVQASAEAVLRLHAAADEACADFVFPPKGGVSGEDSSEAELRLFILEVLARNTLACLDPDVVRVLPKLRTAQVGITLRSASLHLAVERTEVAVGWHRHFGNSLEKRRRLNLLLMPWPLAIEPRAFQPVSAPPWNAALRDDDDPRAAYLSFDFDPPPTTHIAAELKAAVLAARARCGPVDGVVFPEAALTDGEFQEAAAVLKSLEVPAFLSGIRGAGSNAARLQVIDVGGEETYEQPKHHRWCLDQSQIHQYHLGSSLHSGTRYWENIRVPERSLHFVTLSTWLTLCHLICEDLARVDPVADVVRAVGPSLVIALLLDGPQIERRWPGRYASVLADDPGSSVLTLTSLGMVVRSEPPPGAPRSRVVALWKDQRTGSRELTLDAGSKALLLTLSSLPLEEWSADGRIADRAGLVLSGVEQIAWPPPADRS